VSSPWGRVALAGVYEHPTRYAPHLTAYQIHAESARGALQDAGLEPSDVDALFTSGVGPIGILSLAQHLNLHPDHLDSTSIGGSSFVSHCRRGGVLQQRVVAGRALHPRHHDARAAVRPHA
jgi:acetyl-CoA C-acetyltransferase